MCGKYLKNENYTGFIGAFPMTDPQYSIYLVLDDPKALPQTFGYKTAGWNAAPIVAQIIRRIGPLLGIKASAFKEPDWKNMLKG